MQKGFERLSLRPFPTKITVTPGVDYMSVCVSLRVWKPFC